MKWADHNFVIGSATGLFTGNHNLVIGNYDHRIVYRVDHTTELFMFLIKDIKLRERVRE